MPPPERRTLCPEGNPQVVAPFIEHGRINADGSLWVACVCGYGHTYPPLFLPPPPWWRRLGAWIRNRATARTPAKRTQTGGTDRD